MFPQAPLIDSGSVRISNVDVNYNILTELGDYGSCVVLRDCDVDGGHSGATRFYPPPRPPSYRSHRDGLPSTKCKDSSSCDTCATESMATANSDNIFSPIMKNINNLSHFLPGCPSSFRGLLQPVCEPPSGRRAPSPPIRQLYHRSE